MQKNIQSAVSFLFEMGTLRKLARSHRQTLLTDDLSDNIASHSFRVALIGWMLAKEERVSVEKVVEMCLFHDIEETRTGDQNWIHKRYVEIDKAHVLREQTQHLSQKEAILNIKSEYLARESQEAKIAKDADLLDQILLLREYEMQGNTEATRWLLAKKARYAETNNHTKKNLKDFYENLSCEAARQYAKEIFTQTPSDWWRDTVVSP